MSSCWFGTELSPFFWFFLEGALVWVVLGLGFYLCEEVGGFLGWYVGVVYLAVLEGFPGSVDD